MSPALTPAQPARRNMAARPPLPEPGRPPAPRYQRGGEDGSHAAAEAGPGLPAGHGREVASPPGGCHGPAGSGPRRAARPARRYLVGAPPPARGRPKCRCRRALFWRRFNSRPGRNFPTRGPGAPRAPRPWRGRRPRASLPEGPLCAPAPTHPPAGQAGSAGVPGGPRRRPPPSRRGPAPHPPPPLPLASPRASAGDSESPQPHAGAANGPRPAPVPGHAAAPRYPGPFRPTRLRTGPHTTGFTHSAEGRADSPGGVAATIFASPAAGSRSRLPTTSAYYDREPQAGGAAGRPARPPRGFAKGASRAARGGGRPHPSASPEGAKWRETQVGAAAAPRRTMG
nr:proline-rich protein 2-like [Camelus dromedarius]